MTKIKVWAGVALLAVVAIFALGWLVVLSPQKSKVSQLHSQAADEETSNQTLQSQIALLKKQQAQIPAEQASIAAIQSRLPATPALAAYVRSLSSAAAATKVELVSIAPANPAVVTAVANAVATAPAAAASPAATAAPAASLSAIQVTIDIAGDYYAVQQFLSKLETLQRVTIVSSVSMQPGDAPKPQGTGATPDAPNSQWKTLATQIQATIFTSALPDSSGAAPAATPGSVPGTAPPATPQTSASTTASS